MARSARGQEVVSKAWEALKQARTVKELRQAQAVILPLGVRFLPGATGSSAWQARLIRKSENQAADGMKV